MNPTAQLEQNEPQSPPSQTSCDDREAMLDCRYGRRYIRRVDDDGEVAYDGLPLKLEDLLHPEEGDELVAVLGHSDDCGRLRKGLTRLTPQNKTFAILEDVNVDLGLPGVKPIRPDVSVFEVPTVPAGLREMGTFYMKRHAAKPVLFIEVTSESTRPNDLVEKYTFAVLYDQHGVVPDSVELAVQLKDERLISQEHKQHAEKANERAEQARLKLEAEKLRADSAEIKIHRLATLATFQRDSRLDCLLRTANSSIGVAVRAFCSQRRQTVDLLPDGPMRAMEAELARMKSRQKLPEKGV